MKAIDIPAPESVSDPEPSQACDLCSKSYQRRDLLMRHRRRCQGPKKSTNRRKACDACVQAKARCDYTQPTCARCAKRGTQCVYAASSVNSTSDRSEQPSKAANGPKLHVQAPPSGMMNLATPNQLLDPELPTWDFPVSSYPVGSSYPNESFDMALADVANAFPVSSPSFTTAETSMNGSSEYTPPGQTLSESLASRGIPESNPLTPSSMQSTGFATTLPSSLTLLVLVRKISEYPSLLRKASFSSPFLHLSLFSLYGNDDPDMANIPLTSMAICCGSGINHSADKRFVRRAINAARQRLIGTFPCHQCTQQWDSLHAMLIYESLEMRESVGDESDAWKHPLPVKGLGSHFLLKMAESYSQSNPEIRNPDVNVFSDPDSHRCPKFTTPWARWRTTETARRTLFFANMVNFCSNYDHTTGKQMPYYEPLNDELILNMPLPCNQAAWLADDEQSWKRAMETQSSPTNEFFDTSLKNILTRYTKEQIRAEIGTNIGYSDADELRRLIILCASEQFT